MIEQGTRFSASVAMTVQLMLDTWPLTMPWVIHVHGMSSDHCCLLRCNTEVLRELKVEATKLESDDFRLCSDQVFDVLGSPG